MILRSTAVAIATLLLTVIPSTSHAAEVEIEGSYQTRGRLFNTLSLTELPEAGVPEGNTFYAEHRLWLRPRILVTDDVRLTMDIKGLDNVPWGDRPVTPRSYTNQALYQDGLSAPISANDPGAPLLDITLWRAWADIDTDYGRLSFGRMPLHWGMGIWQNDGMSLNSEYGDTADRVSFETLIQDTVFVRLALDTQAENFLNAADDTYAVSVAAAYKTESLVLGTQVHYRRTDVLDGGADLDLITLDAAMELELGKLDISAEFLGRFGGGDIPGGLNDAGITAFGGALEANLNLDKLKITVEGGYASGDKDDTDAKVKTFAFDRDHNVGIMMFEQPMPIFATAAPNATNGNRNYDQVLLGNSVSNALYVKPKVTRTLVDGLDVNGSVLLARAAALPERFANRGNYGIEALAGLNWTGVEHFEIDARGGVFLPGTYFKNFTSDTITEGFDRTAFGVQLTGRVSF